MTKKGKILVLKDYKVPDTPGAHYRLACLSGRRKGDTFYLKGNRVVIGRGGESDIQIADAKSSREHAELKKFGNSYILTDLGSQNGTYVNDSKVAQANLSDGDKVIIGQTVLQFGRVEVPDGAIKVYNEKDAIDDVKEDPGLRKKLIWAGALLVIFLFLFDDQPERVQKEERESIGNSAVDVSSEFYKEAVNRKKIEDKEIQTKLEAVLHRGLREARERNYFRALDEFNLALILSPDNTRAKFYQDKIKNLLDKEVQKSFLKAKADVESLKFKSAINTYCGILRLLKNYKDDERYKMAQQNLNTIEERLGMEKNEIKCI